MKKHSGLRIASFILLILETIGFAVLIYYLFKILPTRYLLIAIGAFAVILVAQAFLITRKRGVQPKAIISIVLSTLAILISSLIIYELNHFYKSLENTQDTNQYTITTTMHVYVRKADGIQNLKALSGKTFGIEGTMDGANSKLAEAYIEKTIDASIVTKSLDGIPGLLFGLKEKEVDAIIVNDGYVETFESIDATFSEWAVLLTSFDVSKEVEETKEAKTKATTIATKTTEAKTTESETTPPTETDQTEDTQETQSSQQSQGGSSNNDDDDDYVDTTPHVIEPPRREVNVTQEPFVVYIQGLDTRGKQLVAKTGNSDVNILAFINPQTKQILLLSTPRDYYLTLWGNPSKPDKLTHCGYYGINCGIDALNRLYDIQIDYYVKVGFNSVINIVDALGGVTVESQWDFTAGGYHYTAGDNFMDGKMALTFSRERHALPGGDRARGKNQERVITAIIKQVTNPENVGKINDVLTAFTSNVVTNFPVEKMNDMIRMQLDDMASWSVESIQADGTGGKDYCYSLRSKNDVMYPNYATVESAKAKIQAILSGNFPQN